MLEKVALRQVDTQRKLVRAFSALGDLTRFKIVRRLVDGDDVCVSELASELGVSPSAISQHLRLLELTGLVQPQRMGHKMCYQLKAEDMVVKEVIRFVKKQVKGGKNG